MSAVDVGTAMTGRTGIFDMAVTTCDRLPRLLLVTVIQDRIVVAVATIRRPIVAVAPDRPAGTAIHQDQARLVTVIHDRLVVVGAATLFLPTAVVLYRRVVHRGRRDRVLVTRRSRVGGGMHPGRSRRHRLRNAMTLLLRSVSVL